MACNCADEVDEQLKGSNTRLERALVFGKEYQNLPNLMVRTEQIETGRGKKKAAAMFLTFCPFCGTRYKPEDPDARIERLGKLIAEAQAELEAAMPIRPTIEEPYEYLDRLAKDELIHGEDDSWFSAGDRAYVQTAMMLRLREEGYTHVDAQDGYDKDAEEWSRGPVMIERLSEKGEAYLGQIARLAEGKA